MQFAEKDIRDGSVVVALSEPLHAAVWELVRRNPGPATVAGIAQMAGRTGADVQRALDALADARLVARVPQRGDRRVSAYGVADASIIVIGHDDRDDGDRALLQELSDRYAEHARRTIEAARRLPAGDGELHFSLHYPVRLDAVELAEVRRRLEDLQDYLCNIQAKAAGSRSPDAHQCNYHASVQLHPTRAPVLPLPIIYFVQRGRARESIAKLRGAHMTGLSRRERQVAMELIKGRTRPEVARHLGVTANTVATVCKRIYAKLGIRTRAQLASRLRGVSQP